MLENKCDVGITTKKTWNVDSKSSKYCSIETNDQVLSTVSDSFPTSAALQSALSWLITKTSDTGMYAKAKKEAMTTFVDSLYDSCGAGGESTLPQPLQKSNIEGTTNQ